MINHVENCSLYAYLHVGRLSAAAALCLLMLLQSCTGGTSLRTEAAGQGDLRGSYTLILFGGNFSDDLETVALLDRDDDGYRIEPYAPDFRYRTKKGIPADRALKEAEDFISLHPSFAKAQLKSIRDNGGNIIGYEYRPLYIPLEHGTDDLMDIDYLLQGDRVLAHIRLKPFLEKRERLFWKEHK